MQKMDAEDNDGDYVLGVDPCNAVSTLLAGDNRYARTKRGIFTAAQIVLHANVGKLRRGSWSLQFLAGLS